MRRGTRGSMIDARVQAQRWPALVNRSDDCTLGGAGMPGAMQERHTPIDASALGSFLRHPATAAIVSLGFTQIISWGTTLYALGVLGKPIAADTGWSQTLVFGGLTVGLLVSGAISASVGRLPGPPRRPARHVAGLRAGDDRARGAVAGARSLQLPGRLGLPRPRHAAHALRRGLRRPGAGDALARTAGHLVPHPVRRPCLHRVLAHRPRAQQRLRLAHDAAGVRRHQSLVCLPLHVLGLARRETAEQAEYARATGNGETQHAGRPLEGATRTIAMVLFGAVAAASAVVMGALAVHLVPILEAAGLLAATAVVMASFKGVAQVVGRIWDLTLARKWHPLDVGRVSVGLAAAVVRRADAGRRQLLDRTRLHARCSACPTASSPSCAGAVPLALFGAKGYGEILGILATPYLILAAVSPAAFALVVERWGYGAGEADPARARGWCRSWAWRC